MEIISPHEGVIRGVFL